MKKRNLFKVILVIFILGFFVFPITKIQANDWAITPDPMPVSSSITFCVGAAAPASGLPADYKAEFEFASGFNLTAVTISDTAGSSEVELYTGTTTCSGGTTRITEATETPANDRDYATITGQKLKLDLEDGLSASQLFSIKIVAKAGNSVVTPGSAGIYLLTARVYDTSNVMTLVDADFMYVGSANQVNISANVESALTLALSGTSCALGTFASNKINTCSYDVTVNTNAGTGYIAYVRDDGNLRHGADDINDASGEIADGVEGQGVATSDSDYATLNLDQYITKADCGTRNGGTTHVPAVGMDGTDYSFAKATGPVANDLTTLCQSASIAGSTPAGTYTQTVTITAVAQF